MHDLLLFSFASIMTATCDFSAEKKLGQGGFRPVYKVILLPCFGPTTCFPLALGRLIITSDRMTNKNTSFIFVNINGY